MPPDIWTPPYVPCASVCSRGYLHVIWRSEASHTVVHFDARYVFRASHMSGAHPTHLYSPMLPCTLYVLGGIWCDMGDTPHMLGSWGHQHVCQALGVCQYIHCSQSVGCCLLDWFLRCLLCFMLFLSCSSLCFKSLLPQLWLILQSLLCLLVCHLFHQLPWLPLWWGFLQHWVSVMWFCCHPWHWDVLEVLHR